MVKQSTVGTVVGNAWWHELILREQRGEGLGWSWTGSLWAPIEDLIHVAAQSTCIEVPVWLAWAERILSALCVQTRPHLPLPLLTQNLRKPGAKPSSHWGERRDTPWTGHQRIAGPKYRHKQPVTPMVNSETPICLTTACMSWTVGGSLSTCTGRTCKLYNLRIGTLLAVRGQH